MHGVLESHDADKGMAFVNVDGALETMICRSCSCIAMFRFLCSIGRHDMVEAATSLTSELLLHTFFFRRCRPAGFVSVIRLYSPVQGINNSTCPQNACQCSICDAICSKPSTLVSKLYYKLKVQIFPPPFPTSCTCSSTSSASSSSRSVSDLGAAAADRLFSDLSQNFHQGLLPTS